MFHHFALGLLPINLNETIKFMKTSQILLTSCLCSLLAFSPVQAATPHSGFLDNYDQMKQSSFSGASIWVSPDVEKQPIKRYTKIMLDPAEVWFHPDSPVHGMRVEDLQSVVDYLEGTFSKNLGEHFTIVDEPGLDVLRIRLAITNIKRKAPSKNALDYIPFRLVLNTAKDVVRNTQNSELIVLEMTLESEYLDSVTNKRLATAIDTQEGASKTVGKNEPAPWVLVKDTLDDWAQTLAKRLIASTKEPSKNDSFQNTLNEN